MSKGYELGTARRIPPYRKDPRVLCSPSTADAFYPTNLTGKPDYTDGYDLCFACPLQLTCLEWAVRTGQRWGMWGGTKPEQRTHFIDWKSHEDSKEVPLSWTSFPATVRKPRPRRVTRR